MYIANKQYRRALEFLLIAISAPTVKAVSMIQLLAYRKFILVSFIVEGRIGPLPKYTSAGIEKVASYWSPHHISLVKAFQTTDLDLFQDIASKHSAYFESVSCAFLKLDITCNLSMYILVSRIRST